jgi:geranylgeranyl diphosphate synthase type II
MNKMDTQARFLEAINSSLENLGYPKNPYLLYEPQRYALNSPGKRIRPLISLLCSNMFSDSIEKHHIDAAIALELFHTFTLIHDDIMDKANLRRGNPTVVNKWGLNVAILSGDAMLVKAYKCLANAKNLEVINYFNKMGIEVCEGQQLDVDFEESTSVTTKQYLDMVGKKTSALIATSAAIGALVAGADAESVKNLYDFGFKLGLAFQIQDDFLDTFADTSIFGKVVGGDIVACKKTFPYFIACETLPSRECEQFMILMNKKNIPNELKIQQVKEYYLKANVKDICSSTVQEYMKESLISLQLVDVDESKKELLKELFNNIINRKK